MGTEPQVEPDVRLDERSEAARTEDVEAQNAEIVWNRVSNERAELCSKVCSQLERNVDASDC